MRIGYVNIQCLTQAKMAEVEQMLGVGHDIVLLTETHQKNNKIDAADGIGKIESMRTLKDKKGGGMMALFRNDNSVLQVKKLHSKHPDLMEIEVFQRNKRFVIILVYFSVRNGKEDNERKQVIRREVEEKIEKLEKVPTLIIGDFNGHINGFGNQREDRNG